MTLSALIHAEHEAWEAFERNPGSWSFFTAMLATFARQQAEGGNG